MSRKMLFKICVLAIALTLVFGACAPAQTPSAAPPTQAPTTASAAQPAATAVPTQAPTAEKKDPVKVAVVLNLTTNMALYGSAMKDGVEMATEKWNAAGGIDGHPIELLIEDAADTATTALNAVNKVLEQEPIAMIGPILGAQMIPMRTVIDEEKIPTVSFSGTRGWTKENNQYAFRTGAFDGVTRPAVADFLVQKLGAKKVGILAVANEWGYSGRDHLTAALAKYDIKPIVESYQTADTDMSTQIMSLVNQGVDAIYCHGHPADNAIIMRQYKELGVKQPIIFSDVAQTAVNLDITTPEIAEGIYIQAIALPLEDPDPEIQAWTAAYKQKYNKNPDMYALLQYDGANILYEAMSRAAAKGNLTRAGIVEELRTGEFKELISTYKADKEGNMLFEFLIIRIGKNKESIIETKVKVKPEDVIYELPQL